MYREVRRLLLVYRERNLVLNYRFGTARPRFRYTSFVFPNNAAGRGRLQFCCPALDRKTRRRSLMLECYEL